MVPLTAHDESAAPLLSVVVVIVSDTTDTRADVGHLAASLHALTRQIDPPTMEVIVPYLPAVQDVEGLRRTLPSVVFLPVADAKTFTGQAGSREHHDELRARGLAAARGTIVALVEDHAVADRNWAAEVAHAHQQDFAGIGGAIENGVDRPLNWAIYFCDFSRYQNPVPASESAFVSDANVSYKRSALEAVRPAWIESFREPAVNAALMDRGQKLALSPHVIVYQHRAEMGLGSALKERFIWGRSYGAARRGFLSAPKRLMHVALSPLLPAVLLCRMTAIALQRRRHVGAFLRAFPLTALLTVGWSCGELVGYLTAKSGRLGLGARR